MELRYLVTDEVAFVPGSSIRPMSHTPAECTDPSDQVRYALDVALAEAGRIRRTRRRWLGSLPPASLKVPSRGMAHL